MTNFGVTHLAWLKTWLALPNGIPSPDTIPRLLSRLDPAKLEDCFMDWTRGYFRERAEAGTVGPWTRPSLHSCRLDERFRLVI